ncbi:pseudouridine synthase [Halioxenophilus aromaticivorans]
MVDVIGEYSDFLVVHKPAGCDFHDSDAGPGFFNQVKAGLASDNLWPVHRLDKPTSGLLIMAKTKACAAALGEGFAQGTIHKQYLAVAANTVKKKQGKVVGDMVRARRGIWRLQRTQINPAIMQFTSASLIPGWRLFSLIPRTGRTHQLRVAMKSLGAPILGDTAYSGSSADRLYLHAYGLAFQYQGEDHQWRIIPNTGEAYSGPAFSAALSALAASG